MKKFIKIGLILFIAIFSVSCNNRRNKEKIEYYLSQPRDLELLGWWKIITHPAHWNFKSNARIGTIDYNDDGDLISNGDDWYYWCTIKDDKNRKILCIFYPHSYGEEESRGYYIIRNDSLWKSAYIEGDKFPDTEMYLFGVRCEEPEELKK